VGIWNMAVSSCAWPVSARASLSVRDPGAVLKHG
jgi:hypothetical protein